MSTSVVALLFTVVCIFTPPKIESADLRSRSRDFGEEWRMSSRRDFIRSAAALGIGGFSATTLLEALVANPVQAQAGRGRAAAPPLHLAEWSYLWVGGEPAHLPRRPNGSRKQENCGSRVRTPARDTLP